MAGTDWPFTGLGRTFFEGTLPALVKNVGKLADELKRYNDKVSPGEKKCHRIGGHLSEGCGCETGQLDFPNGIEQEPKERIFVCDGYMCGNIRHEVAGFPVSLECGCCSAGVMRPYVREKK